MSQFNSLEMCAGAGGQALGLEMAGFDHAALVELEPAACATLRLNRPAWNVIEDDLRRFDGRPYQGIDLVAGGVPCPPFSKAGKQLGAKDERDLFPEAALLQRLAAVRGRLSLCADQAAAAKWWLSMPMASVSAEGPMPKALSTRRTSPLMPGCRHQGRACPLRRARMTSNPLIVA